MHDDFVAAPDELGSSISTVTINNGTHCTLYRYGPLLIVPMRHRVLILGFGFFPFVRDASCNGHSRILLFGGEHLLFFKDFEKDMVSSFRCEEL